MLQFHQRTLLCRVFTVRQQAWQWRQYSVPTQFQRLFAVLDAWRVYTAECKLVRFNVRQNHKAMYFRGASLLAQHFHQWVDYTVVEHKVKRQQQRTKGLLLRVCFRSWREEVADYKQRVAGIITNFHVRAPLRQVLREWHRIVMSAAVYAPIAHYQRALLLRGFQHLKTQRAVRLMQLQVLPLCTANALKAR